MVNRLSTWVLLGVLAGAPGCDKKDTETGTTTEKSGPTDAQKAEGKAIQSGTAKLNLYVECLNAASENVRKADQFWNVWDNNHSKPLRSQSLNAKKVCGDPLQKAKAMSPPMPELHKTGRVFSEAFAVLDKAYSAREKFATSKAYEDDASTIQPFDAAIQKALAALTKPEAAMIAAFTKEEAKHNKRQLEHLAKTEGKKLRYLHLTMMNSAKDLVATVSDASKDKAAIKAAAEAFEKAHQAALRYVRANPKEYQGKAVYGSIQIPGETLIREAKAAAEKHSERKTSMATVARHYSEFVRTANHLQ